MRIRHSEFILESKMRSGRQNINVSDSLFLCVS